MSDFLDHTYTVLGGSCIALGPVLTAVQLLKSSFVQPAPRGKVITPNGGRNLQTEMPALRASDMQVIQQLTMLNNKQSTKLCRHGETYCRTIIRRATIKIPHEVLEEYRQTFSKDENTLTIPFTSFATKKLELLLAFHTDLYDKTDEILEEMSFE